MKYKIEPYTLDNGVKITRIINITKDELDLDKTLKCGQAFRWNKVDNITWCGVIEQKIVLLAQLDFKDNLSGIATNLNIEDAKCLIYYLDLDINYTDEISKLNLDNFAKEAYKVGNGIHILKQDLFEMMVTFLMSQFNSMRNISNIVEKLSKSYGNRLETEFNGRIYERYSFPTIEQFKNATEDEIKSCSVGLRTKYLINMIFRLNRNPEIIKVLQNSNYNEALKILKSFDGIGDKVANCITLFGLHHIEAFPIDLHIQRIIDEHYDGIIDINKYGKYAGIIQQYMYYYKAFYSRRN